MIEVLEMPKSWEILELGSLCSIVSGNTPKGLENISNIGNTQFYKVSDMNLSGNELFMKVSNNLLTIDEIKKLKIKIYPKGTVIFPKRGGAILTNKKRILGSDASFDLNLMGIVPNQHILSKLIFYFFYRVDLGKICDGSSVPQINNKHIEPLLFPLPPLPEQHRIVAKIEELFSELDKGIETLKTAKQQLKVYRQAVLKYAFEGKLTNPDVKYGELPEGWVETITSKILDVRDGTHDTPSYIDKNGIPLITSKNLKGGKIDFTKVSYISLSDHNEISKRSAVEKGDILFAMIGTIGNPVVIKGDEVFSIKNVGLFKKNPKEIISEYLCFYLGSKVFEDQLERRQLLKGTTQKFIPLGHLRNIYLPLPSILEQKIIVQEIESRLSVCDKIEESIEQGLQQAEALRQSILKKAFEGKLVPQDPNDEPASVLLERIKAERNNAQPEKRTRTKKVKA